MVLPKTILTGEQENTMWAVCPKEGGMGVEPGDSASMLTPIRTGESERDNSCL